MTLLRLDASFTMTPCATSESISNFNRVSRPKPENRSPMVYPNHQTPLEKRIHYTSSMISTRVTVRPRPPDYQVLQCLHLTCPTIVLTWSTQSTPPHAHLLVDVPKCQPPMISLPSILVPRSNPHVRPSMLLAHQHGTPLRDLLHDRRPSLCSTPAHQHSQETYCPHTARVSLKLNRSLDHLLTITHHQLTHMGTYQPCVCTS